MKHIRKILAIAMVMVMALTALTFSGGAESIYDTAKSITNGQTVNTVLYNTGDYVDYKVNVTSSGLLKLSLTAKMQYTNIYVYDANGNKVPVANHTYTSSGYTNYNQKGDSYFETKWNSTTEQFVGTVSYQVTKGTYYIRIERYYSSRGDGNIKLTATFPSTTASKGKLYYLSLTVDKGDTIKLGAVVSSGSKVTWTSSKPAVASVSSGKVTAKTKGSTIITAKCGSTSQKIKITVV